jgi:CRP/FNR family transcriptional regulator
MANNVVDLDSARSVCQQCGIFKLCFPMGLNMGELDKLDSIIKRRQPLEKGQYLYQAGDPFKSIFALRSGSLKTYLMSQDGNEHVIGIKMPGDLLGLSAINGEHFINSAKALETSSVCEIPYERLEELACMIPGLQHHLSSMMSREIQEEQEKVAICGKMPAEARLASVLVTLSERFASRGFSANDFNLSMSRSDIANMLGLAVETVSRLFSHFQEEGLIKVERKHVQILDKEKLTALIKMN